MIFFIHNDGKVSPLPPRMKLTSTISPPRYIVTGRATYRLRWFYDPVCREDLLRLERRCWIFWRHLHDYSIEPEWHDADACSPCGVPNEQLPQPNAAISWAVVRKYEGNPPAPAFHTESITQVR